MDLKSRDIKIVAYADDDMAILARCKFLDTLSELTEGAFTVLSNWALC